MLPILLSFGPVTIYSFGLFLAIGMISGAYYVWKHARNSSLSEEKVLDATAITILGGLIGARLLYVLSNLPQFSDDLRGVFAFWNGGLTFWGALLGGLVTLTFLARRFRYPLKHFLDLAAPALAIGSFWGFIGAFLAGSAYGAETSFFWGVPQRGITGQHHPTQLFEAFMQLGIYFVLVKVSRNRTFAGSLGLVYILSYSIGRFIIEFFRGDTTRMGFLSQAQVICLIAGALCFLLLYLRLARLQGSWRINILQILRTEVS